MANPTEEERELFSSSEQLRLVRFRVDGLFSRGAPPIEIEFPPLQDNKSEASVLILQGRNGTGKTTILKMIAGMLELDFDVFRAVPFTSAILALSGGHELRVKWRPDARLPLLIEFGGLTALLAAEKEPSAYSPSEANQVKALREFALPTLKGINFEFLEVTRSPTTSKDISPVVRPGQRTTGVDSRLSASVRRFIRDAQIDSHQFFRSEERSLLPAILGRLHNTDPAPTQSELAFRIESVVERSHATRRYGLHTDLDSLRIIASVLSPEAKLTERQLAIVEPYVTIQESGQAARDLIARRLQEFELIMDDFLTGKRVTVGAEFGIRIESGQQTLPETALSSGEFHFLYMMVKALLCQRVGSIIAIDEPELSLHVSWQRKLLTALSRCAAGASPLFICATHSVAISAEHADRVQVLSAVD